MLKVKEFFGMGTREFATEWKAMPEKDREELKTGIENGTLT